jgi:hypothetical protein
MDVPGWASSDAAPAGAGAIGGPDSEAYSLCQGRKSGDSLALFKEESFRLWISGIFHDSGGDAVQGYHLYFMDRYSGHIDHRRDFLAEDDSAAVATAQGWYGGAPMELWLGGRKIKRWEERPLAPLGGDSGPSHA